MKDATKDALLQLATAGLKVCLLKVNTVVPGTWRLEALEARAGSVADALRPAGPAPAVIRITVQSSPPIITLLAFKEADAGHIYGCFVSDFIYGILGPGNQEITLQEIGNILLNALANSLLKAFRKSAIPSVPERVLPTPEAITAPPAAHPKAGASLTIVTAKLAIERDGRRAQAHLIALVPEGLETEEQE